jgi:hypothetical protein
MAFKYNVGLQNVGSYQVSGRPWCKHFSITTNGEYGYVQFPNVTKSIFAHFEADSNGHEIQLAFCEPRSAMDMPDDREYFEASGFSLEEFTVSFWIKEPDTSTRIIQFNGNSFVTINSSGDLLLYVEGTPGSASNISQNEWTMVSLSMKDGEQKVYLNGEEVDTTSNTLSQAVTELSIGTTVGGVNSDGQYDDMALFNKVLTPEEVLELYTLTSLNAYKNHSQGDSLVSFWDFEANTYKEYYSTPDNGRNVYDRISNFHLSWNGGGSTSPQDATYVNSRVMDNAFANHKVTLSSHQEITLPFKTSGLVWYSTNQDEFSLYASLTNIPASRMHELTGPGIDE